MTSQPTVIVDIDDKGNATFRVEGVPGPACKSLTDSVEKALGKVVSSQNTSEYNQLPSAKQKLTLGNKK